MKNFIDNCVKAARQTLYDKSLFGIYDNKAQAQKETLTFNDKEK